MDEASNLLPKRGEEKEKQAYQESIADLEQERGKKAH
jgi:hypothetical protein